MRYKLIIADYIYTQEHYVESQCVVFDDKIVDIGDPDEMKARYKDAEEVRTKPHTVLYPGLVNTHVHLEFSANRTSLTYGDFIKWLDSVIEHRDELVSSCSDEMMEDATVQMLRSGITSFGAISSFGGELEVCRRTPQRVTFFNELIGSTASAADMLYNDFAQRVEASMMDNDLDRITPAVAIHAPYSVHPVLLSKAIALAQKHSMPLSTHFLESPHEREWLESHSGGFLDFFRKFFGAERAVTDIDRFIKAFDDYPALFVHCTQASREELEYLHDHGHSVAHCPRSNRLLDCGRLHIEDIDAPLSVATDGLSSNWSLNIWDELRAALMIHHRSSLHELAQRLIKSVTSDAARSIRSNVGNIAIGAPADIVTVVLPEHVSDIDQVALQTILHTTQADMVYIGGEHIRMV